MQKQPKEPMAYLEESESTGNRAGRESLLCKRRYRILTERRRDGVQERKTPSLTFSLTVLVKGGERAKRGVLLPRGKRYQGGSLQDKKTIFFLGVSGGATPGGAWLPYISRPKTNRREGDGGRRREKILRSPQLP